MSDPTLSRSLTVWFWFIFGVILLGIVFRAIPSDLISWLGLALAAFLALGAGLTSWLISAALDAARAKASAERKKSGQ